MSPYVELPIRPLAEVWPELLAKTEAELKTAHPAVRPRLEQKAALIRHLMAWERTSAQ